MHGPVAQRDRDPGSVRDTLERAAARKGPLQKIDV